MSVTVFYFASLRDRAGRDSETVPAPGTAAELYETLDARHGFRFDRAQLRVAINGALGAWDRVLSEGDEIVFIPPVSGG